MNINTPLELIDSKIKYTIQNLKNEKIKYSKKNKTITFIDNIKDFNATFHIKIYYSSNKIKNICYIYNSDESLDRKENLKKINLIKETYINNFDKKRYLNSKDSKSFWYLLKKNEYDIYIEGSAEKSKYNDLHIGITYSKKKNDSKVIKTNKKDKKAEKINVKDKHIKILNQYNNKCQKNWYGVIYLVNKNKRQDYPCLINTNESKIIIHRINKHKVEKTEIDFEQIIGCYRIKDCISIWYNDKNMLINIIDKEEIKTISRIIYEKIGYYSENYGKLRKIIRQALIEYDPFGEASEKEKIHKHYIKHLPRELFKEKEINEEIILHKLMSVNFDFCFYIDWKNFAKYLYEKLQN